MLQSKTRIEALDFLRFIAIALVIGYHYFAAFTYAKTGIEYYPYGSKYENFFIFQYGYLGVELFFIISGFVIFMTLERSVSFASFILKRFIRLFPPILLCSIFTFLFIHFVDSKNIFPSFHRPVSFFIPSLTFIEPSVWEKLLNKKLGYIDGVYWSLAVEVKFYFLSGILFFFNKIKFFRNWLVLVSVAIALQLFLIQSNSIVHQIKALSIVGQLLNYILFPQYILYFLLGMLFYKLFKQEKVSLGTIAIISILFFIQLLYVKLYLNNWVEKFFIIVFVLLFICFVFKSSWVTIFSNKLFTKIGLSSYSLYLIHENIGVVSIRYLAKFFSIEKLPEIVVLPVLLLILLGSFIIYKKVEFPISKLASKQL